MIQANELFLIDKEVHALLSKEIITEYNKLLETVSNIPENYISKTLIEFGNQKISIANLISYQIGWGTLLIGWYTACLKGEKPEMPGEGFTYWNYTGLAHHFYKKYAYSNLPSQLRAFKKIVNEIVSLVEKEYKTGNLEKVGIWSWCTLQSGKQWPLSKWVKVNTASPYKRASNLIKRALKNIKEKGQH